MIRIRFRELWRSKGVDCLREKRGRWDGEELNREQKENPWLSTDQLDMACFQPPVRLVASSGGQRCYFGAVRRVVGELLVCHARAGGVRRRGSGAEIYSGRGHDCGTKRRIQLALAMGYLSKIR